MSLPPNSDLTAEMEADYEELENNRAEEEEEDEERVVHNIKVEMIIKTSQECKTALMS